MAEWFVLTQIINAVSIFSSYHKQNYQQHVSEWLIGGNWTVFFLVISILDRFLLTLPYRMVYWET